MKVCRREDKPFAFFLFSNLLLYGTKIVMNLKEKYKISHQFPINGMRICHFASIVEGQSLMRLGIVPIAAMFHVEPYQVRPNKDGEFIESLISNKSSKFGTDSRSSWLIANAGVIPEDKAHLKWAWQIVNDVKSFVVFAKVRFESSLCRFSLFEARRQLGSNRVCPATRTRRRCARGWRICRSASTTGARRTTASKTTRRRSSPSGYRTRRATPAPSARPSSPSPTGQLASAGLLCV